MVSDSTLGGVVSTAVVHGQSKTVGNPLQTSYTRTCFSCGFETRYCTIHGNNGCFPAVDDFGNEHNVNPMAFVCSECLWRKSDDKTDSAISTAIRVRVLRPPDTKIVVLAPAIGWQCQNPKHSRPVRNRKGKIIGIKGKVHFSHKHDVCPACDPRVTDKYGTRVVYLPWPSLMPIVNFEMPCLKCAGGGKLWR